MVQTAKDGLLAKRKRSGFGAKEIHPAQITVFSVWVKQGYANIGNLNMPVVLQLQIHFICCLGVNSTARLAAEVERNAPNDFLARIGLPETWPMSFLL